MVRAGHTAAWDYPMDVFRSAVKEIEEAHSGDA
jgi:hypothetical protein